MFYILHYYYTVLVLFSRNIFLWTCISILIPGQFYRDLLAHAEALDEQKEGVVNRCLSPYMKQPDCHLQ